MSSASRVEIMRIYQRENVVDRLMEQGGKLVLGIEKEIRRLNLVDYFQLRGKPSNLIYVTRDQNKERSQPFRTLFLQETLKRGLIMPSLVVSRAHEDRDIEHTIEAVGEALEIYSKALSEGVEKYLIGRPVKPVFRQLN